MTKTTQYKNTPIGPIPTEWEVKKLGDIGKVRMCKRIFSHQTAEIGDIPFYKIGTFGKIADSFFPSKPFVILYVIIDTSNILGFPLNSARSCIVSGCFLFSYS